MALFENFPYTNIHELNLDWIVKIAKDFLEQYTHIQQLISDGETSLTNLTESGLEQLQAKADALEAALQAWYNTHSEDIAQELADALADLNNWYNTHQGYLEQYVTDSVYSFTQQANQKAVETLQTIPDDYSVLGKQMVDITGNEYQGFDNDILFGTAWTLGKYCNPSGSNMITNAGYNTSDYIESAPARVYYIPDHTGVFIHFFDESKNWISARAVSNPLFSTPAGTKYMKISVQVTNPNSTHIITDGIIEMTDYLANTTWTDGMYIEGGKSHSGSGAENWATSDFIPMYPSKWVTMQNCAGCFFNYYNPNKTWLSGDSYTTNTTIQLPTNEQTSYIRISIPINNKSIAHLNGNIPVYVKKGKYAFDYIYQNKDALDDIINRTDVHIGPEYEFTTLREGIAYACNKGNCKVFVHPGTYDIVSEFENEISETMKYAGIGIGNNVEIYFYDGAEVTANVTSDRFSNAVIARTIEYFNPFYSFASGDWKIENLHMTAHNTRYCIHDESAGTGTARHEMKNCRLIHTNDLFYFSQCIGGGLGRHTNVIIDGGYFESHIPSQNPIVCVSYHNGVNSDCKSSIFIKNIYIADNCKLSFGYYGASTEITPIEVCGCSLPNPIELKQENPNYDTINMAILEFCNVVRN